MADPADAEAQAREWAADAAAAVVASAERDAPEPSDDADALLATRLAAFFGAYAPANAAVGGEAPKIDVDAALARVAVARPARPPAESFTKLALIRLDALWAEHLLNMSYLKESVQLRGLQQTDPYQEYAREGRDLFTALQTKIKADTVYSFFQLAKDE